MPTRAIRVWRSRAIERPTCEVGRGDLTDYALLAPLHYRAGRPATIDRVLRATDPVSGELAGVLVTSWPTLNGAWRRLAFGDRFNSGERSADAAAINRELRTISRVIVDPRFRGLGVGTGLVMAYLGDPTTRCTEAITALGSVCPFFERAGMRPITIPRPARDRRLMRSLGRPDPAAAAEALVDATPSAEPALRVWARSSASTRRLADGDLSIILNAAAGALLAPPLAYAHG